MPADPRLSSTPAPITPATGTASKKRNTAPKRGAIACVRCKERKAKCVPAPPGTSPVPTCTNCLTARKECVYLERTPNEIFLLEYVSQLEARCAALEMEVRKLNPSSGFASDHIQMPAEARTAAVDKLNEVYPPTSFPDSGSSGGVKVEEGMGSNVNDDEEADEDDFALGIGMLSLGGGEEPVYVGPSSGVNWARVCATALRRPRDRTQPSHLSRFSYLAPPELASVQSALEYTLHHPTPPLPSPALAAHYLDLVYEHIQARYGCFDWAAVRNWHDNRESICQGRPLWGVGSGQDERRSLAAFFMWLCYGYGARLSEGEKLEGAVSHEVYYNAAVACLSTLTSHHSLATVQALVFLTIYGFRHPTAEVSVWQVGGLAMRTAVEIGMHRGIKSKAERERDPVRYEMKKRVFWAVYSLDRMMSAQLGRPSGIQDRDIDVELPLNVNVEFKDPKALAAMQNRQIELMGGRRPGDEYTSGYGPATSMTSAIHNIRLNQLKQLTQDAIYRLDKPLRPRNNDNRSPERETIPEVDNLLIRLGQWRACHPETQQGVPGLSRDHWELEYHNCVQLLLRPIVASRKAARRYVSSCLESAAALCETQYLYLQPPVLTSKLSTWRFYRLFLAGMTILHIVTTFDSILSDQDRARAEGAIRRCQGALGVWGEKFRGAKRHEKLFGELVRAWEGRKTGPAVGLHSEAAAAGSTDDIMTNLFGMVSHSTGVYNPAGSASLPPHNQTAGGNNYPQFTYTPPPPQPQHQPSSSYPSQGQSSQVTFSGTSDASTSSPVGNQWAGMFGELGGGMNNDLFSLMSSFGADIDNQTPMIVPDGSEPIFDFSASQLGLSTNDGGVADALSWNAGNIVQENPLLPCWGAGPGEGLAQTLGGPLGGSDPNFGMGDWAGLFDGLDQTENVRTGATDGWGGYDFDHQARDGGSGSAGHRG
ncbi:hypothetical protein CI109_103585 [Kwoniella shandongensis]|uniref:Uncharacterized protein n=1 Tax=Kwoniella shandongensis TaxID=1734106 RepID=A0A5M6C8C6_9TREE|nr:uncharacterized protein CI109_000723 [Kwoniella shandongensis]KAA5531151.1 hypothetical protein CI109_000723 [Kwoniella shandongensis]